MQNRCKNVALREYDSAVAYEMVREAVDGARNAFWHLFCIGFYWDLCLIAVSEA